MVRYRLQHEYEEKSLILGRFFWKLGISPDILTLLSLPLSLGAAYCVARGRFILGVLGICLVGLVDILDGATARAGGTCTPFGTVFDHVVDRYTEFILFAGVLLSGHVSAAWVMFAIAGMIMASYTRAKAESSGGLEACTVGWVGRTEKLMLLMLGLVLEATLLRFPSLQVSLIVIGLLSHLTTVQRLLYARTMILKEE